MSINTSAVVKCEAEEVPAAESEDLGVSGIRAHFSLSHPLNVLLCCNIYFTLSCRLVPKVVLPDET